MRQVKIKNRTVFETDLIIPKGCTALGMSIWCAINLTKKLELNFEQGIAQFINTEDAVKFEKEYG